MDDEDGKGYPPNSYHVNRQKFPVENVNYPRNVGNSYVEDDDNDEEEEEDIDNAEDNEDDDDDDDDGGNGVQRIGKDDYEYGDDGDDDDDFGDLERHPKKRKLKTLLSSYEFAPRVPAPSLSSASASVPKTSYGGRNPLTDWTEHETFILLDAWGDRFLKQGKKSLRSEEWQEVAEKVSQESKIERTDTQCRNRLDTLKKKYKKEKMKLGDSGSSASNWVYFKKLDALLSSLPQQAGLSCGVDSEIYLNRSNGLDEMRDSPENSASAGGGEDESEGLPPQKTKNGGVRGNAASFKLLADSIQKFSEIYQKIENSKRQQMAELEKMRMDFHRDLEFQKRQILERAQAEIEKIRRGEDDDNEASAENLDCRVFSSYHKNYYSQTVEDYCALVSSAIDMILLFSVHIRKTDAYKV
ncbi:UNVERIFIED_CONTAM: Trihelix transcription factor ASIL1 [Sesamum radiatum]|uniref:Trihelix transcription factor ASIL1 n=2 Tax=Sesamum TaxID=4181 RepID=A0AAW2WMN6_SESRA